MYPELPPLVPSLSSYVTAPPPAHLDTPFPIIRTALVDANKHKYFFNGISGKLVNMTEMFIET